MAEDLKRRIWLIALTALVMFFSFPVVAMLFTTSGNYEYDSYYNSFQRHMEVLVSLENTWMPVFICVAVMVVACSSFSYLNSKSKVDFYHSLPVRREKLYLVNYINGYLIMAVIYALFLLLAILIGGVYGADGKALLILGLEAYFVNMSFALLLYATVTVALMMTGNRIVGLLGVGVFYFYIPLTTALLEGFCSTWLLTYYSNGQLVSRGMWFSPVIQYIMVFGADFPLKNAGIALIVGLLITVLALWLYKKRPSEGAGKSLVFGISKPVIRIAITMTSAMAGALFGWSIRSGMGWSLFFLVCGAVVAHCVIEIIYHADFKKLFCNRLHLAGCIVAGVALVAVFRYDVTGYDRYLPKADTVASVSIDISDLDNWVEYGEAELKYDNYLNWSYISRTDSLFKNMSITDPEPARILAGKGIEAATAKRQEMSDYRYYYNYASLYIKYQLKSGKTVTRCYDISFWDIEDLIEDLYQQDEFKYGMYPLLRSTEGTAFARYDQNNKSVDLFKGEAEKAQQFYEAYRQDFMEQTIAARRQENPIAQIRFVSSAEQVYLQTLKRNDEISGRNEYEWRESNIMSRNYYPVYPSFERTIALLHEAGIEPESPLKGRTLTGIGLKAYAGYLYELTADPAWEGSLYNEYVYADLTRAQFEDLAGRMYPIRYSHYNSFVSLDERVEIILSFVDRDEEDIYYDRDGTYENSWNYAFPVDEVPESVNREIRQGLDNSF